MNLVFEVTTIIRDIGVNKQYKCIIHDPEKFMECIILIFDQIPHQFPTSFIKSEWVAGNDGYECQLEFLKKEKYYYLSIDDIDMLEDYLKVYTRKHKLNEITGKRIN